MSILDALMSIPEASKKVHIAEKTLRNWRSIGIYPQIFVKLGGRVFVDIREIERLLEVQKQAARDQLRRIGS